MEGVLIVITTSELIDQQAKDGVEGVVEFSRRGHAQIMKERDQPERHALLPLVDAGQLSSVLGKPVVRDGRKAVVGKDSALQALEVDQNDIVAPYFWKTHQDIEMDPVLELKLQDMIA